MTFFAATLGAVLFVVFAATLAVMVLLAALLVGLVALSVWPRRRRPVVARGVGAPIRVGRPPAHAWIAYQWDRP